MQLAEVDLESARWHRKQPNPLAPEDFGDERFFAFPANSAILAYRAHDVTFIVPDLIERIWETADVGLR